MRILQMSRWFFPHVGGASIRVYQIAKNLAKSGHEVHLLTHNPKSIGQCNLEGECPLYEKHPDGFYVYRLPYYNLGKSFNWAVSIPLMAKKAIEIIKKENIDVILSHNPPYLVGAASLKASVLTGKPMVTVVHDVWGASHYGAFEYGIGRMLESLCVKRSKRLIAPLDGLDDVLIERYGVEKSRFVTAPTGVDAEKFGPLRAGKVQLSKLLKSINAEPRLVKKLEDPAIKKILFLGILAPWSGGSYFVKAAKKVVQKFPKTVFVIVGHGVQYGELVEMVDNLGLSENVAFLGAIKYEDVPLVINFSDVCVSSFPKPETVGRDREMPVRPVSTLEFMSCGKPVILSDIPGARVLIKDGEDGLLFKPENADELAGKMVYLLENPGKSAEIGKRARATILAGGTWANTTKIVESALEGVMGK